MNRGTVQRAGIMVGVCTIMVCSSIPVDAASLTSKRIVEQLTHAVETSHMLSQRVAPYDSVFRRNPLQRLVDGEGQWVNSSGLSSGLSVQGIIWSDQQPFTIVDDELYAPGAVVGPYTIAEIQEHGVVVQREQTQLFIPLDRGVQTGQAQRSLPRAADSSTPPTESEQPAH